MKKNVGATEKQLRVVVGILLLSLLFVLDGNARWLGLLGLIPLLTGLFSFCPVYWLVGKE